MLQEAIEKNRGFLKVCAVAAVIGAFVYSVNSVLCLWPVLSDLGYYFAAPELVVTWIDETIASIMCALISLAVGESILWAIDHGHRLSWILRNVNRILYVYVASTAIFEGLNGLAMCIMHDPTGPISLYDWFRCGALMTIAAVICVPWILLGIAAGKGVRLMEEYQKGKMNEKTLGMEL